MSAITNSARPVTPANQKLRIAVLRLLFLLALLPILWGHSRWSDAPAAVLNLAGVLLIFTAVLGRLWAILYIGGRKNAEVMCDGPYSICRHPLYFFSTLGVAGFGLLLESLILAIGFGAAALVVLSVTARREERYLMAQFGADYAAYRAKVPMIWPAPGLFHSRTQITVSVPTLRRNLADALVFLSALPLAEAIKLLHQHGHLLGFGLY